VSFEPQGTRCDIRVDPSLHPPHGFITVSVDFAMMTAAQRHREFVTDLPAQRSALREAKVMSIRGLPSADQAGMGGHELDVLAIAQPARFRKREDALVDCLTSPTLPGSL
jgi:hypothetical protein